jgi:hypothetical protein
MPPRQIIVGEQLKSAVALQSQLKENGLRSWADAHEVSASGQRVVEIAPDDE